jgi:hypothetical protein
MNKYEWKLYSDTGGKFYYYHRETGKVSGFASKHVNHDVWYAMVYLGDYTFTITEEKHLGQYIDLEFAKKAVERFWDVQDRTLLEN